MAVKFNWKQISVNTFGASILLAATVMVFSQQPQGPRQGPPLEGPGGLQPGFGFPGGPPPGGPDGFLPGGQRPGGPGRPFGPPDGLGPFGRELNLTDDQRAAIKKINDSFVESNQGLQEQMRTLIQGQTD